MGELRVIGRSSTVIIGEDVQEVLRITWRDENTDEVALAEEAFKEYINKGWLAIGEASGRKKQIFTFDPNLEKITLVPLVMGG